MFDPAGARGEVIEDGKWKMGKGERGRGNGEWGVGSGEMMQETIDLPQTGEQRLKMSYEEFLAWSDEDTHAEWVDGEVTVFMPPLTIHQRITFFLARLIALYVDLFNLGEVLIPPYEMQLRPGSRSREPDVMFVAREHQERITDKKLEGGADLVIELISEDSVARDRVDKFAEYQAGGVREYWIIDPRPGRQRVECYWRTPVGEYEATVATVEGRYVSQVLPGFWLRAEWLWQEPLPDPLLTLLEIPAAAQALREKVGGQV